MKDFQDYLNYLSEQIEADPDSVPVFQRCYQMDKLSPENFSAFMQNYSEEILSMAGILSMYYLRIYHEWLSEQTP